PRGARRLLGPAYLGDHARGTATHVKPSNAMSRVARSRVMVEKRDWRARHHADPCRIRTRLPVSPADADDHGARGSLLAGLGHASARPHDGLSVRADRL